MVPALMFTLDPFSFSSVIFQDPRLFRDHFYFCSLFCTLILRVACLVCNPQIEPIHKAGHERYPFAAALLHQAAPAVVARSGGGVFAAASQ
jgi:hypothetical protein